jgi:hypothetical protein
MSEMQKDCGEVPPKPQVYEALGVGLHELWTRVDSRPQHRLNFQRQEFGSTRMVILDPLPGAERMLVREEG